jgi:dolichol-phosphate mannosyltransferase
VFRDRRVGTSKMSTTIALEAMWAVPLLRRTAPAAVAHARTPANAIETPRDG